MARLYLVTATYYQTDRRKKDPRSKAIVLATSKEEAVEKYKAAVPKQAGWFVSARETTSDVYIYSM